MKFQRIPKRPGWKNRADELGYLSAMLDDPPYWVEALDQPFCATLSLTEVEDVIEEATAQMTELSLAAVDYVVNGKDSEQCFDDLRIPRVFRHAIRTSWRRNDNSLYGRFDFALNDGKIKMLELNFDTPTSLYEASVLQWFWLEDLKKSGNLASDADQFNSLHERLIASFRKYGERNQIFHFTTLKDMPEDEETVRYLESCAMQAGLSTCYLPLHEVGFDSTGRLVDLDGRHIRQLFKLYPWEFLGTEEKYLYRTQQRRVLTRAVESNETTFYEPIWKSILSNKAILPIMWKLAPNHPYLLESYIDDGSFEAERLKRQAHVRKPIFGREGGGVSIHNPDDPSADVKMESSYGQEGYIVQAFQALPTFDDYHIVLGSWVIDGQPAGMGMRADKSKITSNTAIFLPHVIGTL